MPNTLGSLNAALIAQRGLELLITDFPLIGQIVNDFSNEGVAFAQTVTTRIPAVGTIQDYGSGNGLGYGATGVSSTDVSVVLDKFKHASFDINDAEFSANTNRNLIEDYAKSFSQKLGAQIMSDIAALWTSGNYPSATTGQAGTTGNRKSIIVAPKKELSKRYVTSSDMFAVFNTDVYYQLFNDDSIVDVTFKGVGISESKLPVIHGVSIAEYQDLQATQNLLGVVGTKDSVVFASRTPSDAGFADLPAVGRISVVTEPKTGLSVQVRESYNMVLGRRQVTYAIIYGCAKGNASSLQRLQSA